jgi:hypothetical protein
MRVALRFGSGLRTAERLHDFIRQARSAAGINRPFDFELRLQGEPTSSKQLLFCLHWLKARGHAAQFAAPSLQPGRAAEEQLKELAAVCMTLQAALSLSWPIADLENLPASVLALAR